MQFNVLTYSLLACITPILVLVNCILFAKSPKFTQPLQSLSLASTLMTSEPATLAKAYAEMSPSIPANSAQASIVKSGEQHYLEFYHSLNAAAQTPSWVLVLDTQAEPTHDFRASRDRTLSLGQLQTTAGQQNYPIPDSVDVSQYLSVVIWCPELGAIMGYAPLSIQS
ncbi:MAG: DM13 domain-containing protein [Leptolyngbya sp. SIOISBB]|nr:DM13 domain-containing protein [Leptolyngbya sp. SIOISBB]